MRKITATYLFSALIATSFSVANAATTPGEQPNLDMSGLNSSETTKLPPTNKNGNEVAPAPDIDNGQNSELKHDIDALAAKYNLKPAQIKDMKDDATTPDEPPAGATMDETADKLSSMEADRVKTAGNIDLKTLEDQNENHHDDAMSSRMMITIDAYRLKGSEDDVNEKYKILSESSDPTRKAFIDSAKSFDATPIIQKAKLPVALNKYGFVTKPVTLEDLKTKTVATADGNGVNNINYGDAVYVLSPKKSETSILLGFHDSPCQFTDDASVCTQYDIMEPVANSESSKVIKSAYNQDDQSIDVLRYSVKLK